MTQKIHDTTVHLDSVGKDQQCRGYSLWRLTDYNYNRLPDEFTTIQAQIEMYLLNLTRA